MSDCVKARAVSGLLDNSAKNPDVTEFPAPFVKVAFIVLTNFDAVSLFADTDFMKL